MAPSSKFASVNLNKSYGRLEGGSSAGGAGTKSRLQNHGGMVHLSRQARPQPPGTKGLKLTVPRPMNLPSLRRENSGNDPSVPLTGVSTTSGWSKQHSANGGHPPVPANFDRSAPPPAEPTWSPSPHSSIRSPAAGVNALSTKVVLLRGEDFPTLQASLPPAPQTELQHRQREKRQVLKEQPTKLQDPSQQHTESSILEHLIPPKQSLNHQSSASREDLLSLRPCDGSYRKGNGVYLGPPLVRLNHTLNWVDDERETLQSFRPQSDWSEHTRTSNKLDVIDEFVSRNGLPLGYSRDEERNQYPSIRKGSDFTSDRWHGRDKGANGHTSREAYTNSDLKVKNDRDGSAGREGESRHGLDSGNLSSKADVNFNRAMGFAKDDKLWMGTLGSVTDREVHYRRNSPIRDYYGDGLLREGASSNAHCQYEDFANANIISSTRIGQHKGYSRRNGALPGLRYTQENFVMNHEKTGFANNKVQDLEDKNFGKDKQKSYTEGLFMRGTTKSSFLELRSHSALGGMEHANLDVKNSRKKKDVKNEDKLWDPERELFEAELERVQKMLEQEKQKITEEQERAAELARKEQEERERAAQEEEERRLKLEQEAKEAALREEQQVLEATKKLEEERRARMEEKRRIALEEERRKEAARRKLLELEERIAKREAEKKKEDHVLDRVEDEMPVERQDADGTPLCRETRILNNMDQEERKNMFQVRDGSNHDEAEHASFLPYPPVREIQNEQNLQTKWLERFPSSFDVKSSTGALLEQPKTMPAWRRDTIDSGSGSVLIPPRDNSWQHEHVDIVFPSKDSLGARNRLPSLSEDRGLSDPFTKKNSVPENSNQDTEFSARHSLSDINSGHCDSFHKREMDQNWRKNNRDWLQNGPCLPSPPLPSYLQGADFDSSSVGRSRQSLPRQPRVLPPPSRAPLQKHALKVEINLSLTSTVSDGADIGFNRGHAYLNETMQKSEHESTIMDVEEHVDNTLYESHFSHDIQPSEQEDAVILQLNSLVQPYNPSQSSEVDSQESITLGSPSLAEMRAESTFLDIIGKVNDEDSNDCLAIANEEVFDSEIAKDFADASKEAEPDNGYMEEEWAVEVGEDSREADPEELSDHAIDETSNQNIDNRDLESIKINDDAISSFVAKDHSDIMLKKQSYEKTCQDEAADLWATVLQSEGTDTGKAEEESLGGEHLKGSIVKEAENPEKSLQETVAEPIIQQGSSRTLTLNTLDSMQSREQNAPTSNAIHAMESREQDALSSRQTLMQQFQQPFSFMSMPLPQSDSTTTSQYSLGLSPVPALQNQLDMPFQFQLGLLPGTTLLPNTIQIGSLHMPLHVQPQIPQFGHLHASQTPLFQFGQIGNSAPLPQPLSMKIHHPLCQNPPPQLFQAHGLMENSCQRMPHVTEHQNPRPVGQEDAFLAEGSTLEHVKLNSIAPDAVEVVSSRFLKPGTQSELVDKVNLKQQKDQLHELPGLHDDEMNGKEFEESLSNTNVRISDSAGKVLQQSQDTEKPSGAPHSERRIGGSGSGFSAWGRGKFYNGKSYSGSNFTSELGTRIEHDAAGNRSGRNKPGRRNLRRTEYRVKESCPLQHAPGGSQSTSSNTSVPFSYLEGVDSLTDSLIEANTAGSNAGQGSGAVGVSHPLLGEDRCGLVGTTPEQNTIADILGDRHSLKGTVNSEMITDKSIQNMVAHVLEHHGIEGPEAADDFIQVRSKRQVLNDRWEQRDKVNRELPKDLKNFGHQANEHTLRKQIVPARADQEYGPNPFISAASQVVEWQSFLPKLDGEAVSSGARHQHDHALVGSNTLESSSKDALQFLGAIGAPAKSVPDNAIEKRAKGLIASHGSSSTDVIFNNYDTSRPRSCLIQDSSLHSTMAWDDLQASSQEVVSLTQIHVESSVKPIYFGSSLPPWLPSPDKVSMAPQSGTPVSMVHEKNTTALSSPIRSALSGERIQFGAITPPTLISPRSQPLSPILFGSSLESREEALSDLKTEVEAEAAASAVAAAAVCNDDTGGSTYHSCIEKDPSRTLSISRSSFDNANLTSSTSAIHTTESIIQAPGAEDSVAVALPADLSIETPQYLFHGPLPQGSSSGFLLPSLPCGPSPFPYLEMGTILGGPIFAFGPREDALCISQGSNKPVPSLEPGIPAVGPALGGWQQYHSGGVIDSFYGGPPSAFPGPFLTSAGGIPSLQVPPHMLLYTNPFTSVGHYGQLGMGFMGPAYIPSGKQPDWKHVPISTTTSLGSGVNDGDRGSMTIMVPQTAEGGPVMMPIAPPLGPFDINVSAPFQVASADVMMQSQWSHVTSHHHHDVPVLRPVMVPTMRHCCYDNFQNQIEVQPHAVERNSQVSISQLATNSTFLTMHAVGQLPDELGLVDPLSLNSSSRPGEGQKPPATRLHVSSTGGLAACGSPVNKVLRGRQSSRVLHGNNTILSVTDSKIGSPNLETGVGSLERLSANGNHSSLKPLVHNLSHTIADGQYTHPVGYTDHRGFSQQGARRVDWAGGHGKGGISGRLRVSDHGSLGERASSSSKLKQVYVAKSSSSQKSVNHDSIQMDQVKIGC